ncbi:MAG: amidohydrolase [Lachnospiraceae bacterium]|nr:amidohydrolase [Lachnospiraceae bacterium]
MEKYQLYKNGKIFTAVSRYYFVEAMIAKDGIITWTGKKEEIPAGDYEEIDLNGACVIPGFVDAHMHAVLLSGYVRQICAMSPKINSITELTEAIQKKRLEQGPGRWCLGWGYDESKIKEKRLPDRYDLDRGCADSPVSIVRTCAHIRCVNSKALEIAGITKDTKDPEGGEIVRDASGEPTGILKEKARDLILDFIPTPDREESVKDLVDLGRKLLSQGIVAIGDMGNLDSTDNYPLFLQASKRGFLQETAVYSMWDYISEKEMDLSAEKWDKNGQIFYAGLKLICDGSVSGKTAWMAQPYLGSKENYGIFACTKQQLALAIDFCKKRHCQLALHAMGTRTISHIIDTVCQEDKWTIGAEPHVRVEHVTDPTMDSMSKAAQNGISVVTQPIFLYSEIESYVNNLGHKWLKRCYPVKQLLDQNVKVCFSTDAPANSWPEPADPFSNIKGSVTRIAYDGTDMGQEQAIDVNTAILLYTREAAEICGLQKLGQLKEGYKAHFIVLDKDIFTIPSEEIDTVKVETVYMYGKEVYSMLF